MVAEPSNYPAPVPLDAARQEMDMLDHRFLYFIDADDGRGKVIYLRHDGDYGLVAPNEQFDPALALTVGHAGHVPWWRR